MSRERRREMVERGHRVLSTVRQCALLGISRSSLNYRRKVTYPEDLAVMKAMDQQYLSTPFYGSRRMRAWLGRQGQTVNRKRVQRLMRTMGLRAIYRRPRTSKPGPRHKVYPYLLGGMEIARPNQVWAADITYIPMAKGFLYLVAIMDWYSRYVVAWRLSNTLDAAFCVEVLDEALRKGKPEVFNTDQGGQFTSEGFIGLLKQHGVSISMDGKGRYSDNIFIERLWRTVKYEEVYLKAYSGGREAKAGLDAYFSFYNNQRPHQALGYRTPAEVFNGGLAPSDERPINGKWTPSRVLADLGKTAGLSLNIAPNLSNSWGPPQRELTPEERKDLMAEGKDGIVYIKKTVGRTDKTNTWTSSGWPNWWEPDTTYAFSDARELEDGEEFPADSISARDWKREYHQEWDSKKTLKDNLIQREEDAYFNSQLWMTPCDGLSLETLHGIAEGGDIPSLIQEIGDYKGPTALLRDAAGYLVGRKEWRKAFRPVLDAAGWRE